MVQGNQHNHVEQKVSGTIDRAKDMAGSVTKRADEALSSAGEKISSFADAIHTEGAQNTISKTINAVGDSLKTSGDYLASHGINDMYTDVAGVVKKYPVHSFWVALGLGALIGCSMKRSA